VFSRTKNRIHFEFKCSLSSICVVCDFNRFQQYDTGTEMGAGFHVW